MTRHHSLSKSWSNWGVSVMIGAGLGAPAILAAWWFWGAKLPVPSDYLVPVTPAVVSVAVSEKPTAPPVTHLQTPEPLKAIYMTSWIAGTTERRAALLKLIDETELNAVVVDIKDYTGKISFVVTDPALTIFESSEERIVDIRRFIHDLHERGVYVIGRISVFQDPHLVQSQPELAVRKLSDGGVWRDRKGLAWVDPSARPAWDYIVALARESYAVGFDEINFDYIRFPSDGNMRDLSYTHFREDTQTRAQALEEFFAFVSAELAPLGVPLSVDFFGLTTVNRDDLGIGQVLESALPYFDYVAPMVYPSHYADGFIGFANPAAHPYEVVKYSMDRAVERISSLIAATSTATTTLAVRGRLRPWLQDFDLGADYNADLVQAQIKAVYDAGLTSWMLWDPSNRYTAEALLPAF